MAGRLLNFSGRRKTPIILQSQSAECALACLAMVAGYYHYDTDLPTLRRRFDISIKGATLLQAMRVAESLGFASRPLRLDMHDLSRLQVPAILHWDLNHFVVLTRVSRASVVIHDPSRGRLKLSLSEVSKHFTGVALELS